MFNRPSAAGAVALLFLAALSCAASAQVKGGGLVDTVKGAVGGVTGQAGIGGTVGGLIGAGISGVGAVGASLDPSARGGISGPGATLGSLSSGNATAGPAQFSARDSALHVSSTSNAVAAALQLESTQQVRGMLRSVNGTTVRVAPFGGGTRTMQASPQLSAALTPFVGKRVYLRAADGSHITSFVGRDDVVRGIVTALSVDTATFVSPNGEVHSVVLDPGGIAKLGLRPGANVVSASHDFGTTTTLALINVAPKSALLDVYLGTVRAVTPNMVTLSAGSSQQSFIVTPATAQILASLRGRTVALDAPDGLHVKSLISNGTLNGLLDAASARHRNANAVTANVIVASRGRLTAQLPNGDVQSFVGDVGSLHLRGRVPITITPLDRYHVRVGAGARAASLADGAACVTVNAQCRGSIDGTVVSTTPTSVSASYPNGDVATFLGDLHGLSLDAGVPITVTPLDATKARISAGGQAADLVAASACVTINDGCRAMPGTVASTGRGSMTVQLADGSKLNLGGSAEGLAAGTPVVVQPLDGTHAIVQAGARAAQVANADACATMNAMCPASTGASSGSPPVAQGGANVGVRAARTAANGCVAVNGNGCAPGTGNAGGGTAGGGSSTSGTVHVGAAAGNTGGTGCVSVNGTGCVSGISGSTGALSVGAGNASGGANVAATTRGPSASVRTAGAVMARCVGVNGCTPGTGAAAGGGGGTAGSGGGGTGAANAGALERGMSGGEGPIAFPGGGQQIAFLSATPTTCSQDGQIATTVVNDATGRPLANARVTLDGPITAAWHTDADGSLRFLRLPTGDYRMTVALDGFNAIASPTFHVDCLRAASLQFRLAASASQRLVSAAHLVRSSVAVGTRPRLSHRAVARTAARHAVCVCTGRSLHADKHGRTPARARAKRGVRCSK